MSGGEADPSIPGIFNRGVAGGEAHAAPGEGVQGSARTD